MRSKTEEWGLGLPDFNEAQEVAEKPKTDILEELKFHADLWDDNEDQEMSVFFVRCLGEIRGLRQQVAEGQAREKALIYALEEIAWHRKPGKASKFAEEIEIIALRAIGMPTDDTALKLLLKSERDRCEKEIEKERVDADASGSTEDFAYNSAVYACLMAIRALGD